MESERFDRLAKFVGGTSSRRAALRRLVASMVGSGLGLAAYGALLDGERALAKKKNKKKDCNGNGQCKNPKNPCKKGVCKHGKCRKKNQPNGKNCGNDRICVSGKCVADCETTGEECSAGEDCCSSVCTCGDNPEGGLCQGDFEQGFEENTDGWTGVDRVASGTDGIPAKSGGFFAKANGPGSPTTGFTRWGGYASVFPPGGYETETAIYIDPENTADEEQFDYSSAINMPNCDHRRDFIFTGGRNGDDYCVTASNNSPGFPCNPQRDPQVLTETGWYTFRHEFRDVAGVLSVDMTLIDPDGDDIFTWTLSDPSDLIGDTVGGNRYGWFPNIEQDFVAIDDTLRTS
ncbi:MAG: hypothetical protein ACRDJC_21585 [Thermomicrobiales bacterium]